MPTCPSCGRFTDEKEPKFCDDCGEAMPPNSGHNEAALFRPRDPDAGRSAESLNANPDAAPAAKTDMGMRANSNTSHGLPARDRPDEKPAGAEPTIREAGWGHLDTSAPAADDRPNPERVDDASSSPVDRALLGSKPTGTFAECVTSPAQQDVDVPPIRLEINDNHFFGEGCDGVLEFRLINCENFKIPDIRLTVSAQHLGPIDEYQFTIRAHNDCDGHEKIQIVPTNPGEHVVKVKLSYRFGGERHVWVSQPSLKVYAKNTNPAKIVIDMSLHAGRNIGYGLDNSVKFNSDLAKGLIKDFNDLIMRQYPVKFRPLDLARKITDGPESSDGITGLSQQRSFGIAVSARASKLTPEWNASTTGAGAQTSLVGIGAILYMISNAGQLVALDARSGKLRWQETIGEPGVAYSFAPVATPGFVFAAAPSGMIHCFEEKTGQLVGQHNVQDLCGQLGVLADGLYVGTGTELVKLHVPDLGILGIRPLGDRLLAGVFGGSCGSSRCLFAPCENSLRLMLADQEGFAGIVEATLAGQPSAEVGIICVPSRHVVGERMRGYLHFLRQTIQAIPCGYQTVERCSLDSPIVGSPVSIGSSVCVACSNSDIVMLDLKKASDESFEVHERWKKNVDFRPARGMAYSGKRLFVCCSRNGSGVLRLLDANDGKPLDKVEFQAEVHAAPLIMDEVVYVATCHGEVHAYRTTG